MCRRFDSAPHHKLSQRTPLVFSCFLNSSNLHSMQGKWVRRWLLVIIAMIVLQVLIGGVTRLTDSGLSITEWEVVKGVLPPIGESAWQENFNKYKTIPQYEQLHPDMTLSEFKFIYFWEWIHR